MARSTHTTLRNLAAAVCILIVISSAAALFSIHDSSLNHGRSLKRFDEFKDAINNARGAQVAFKTQVQEWKNILLRGQEAKDYDLYVSRFTESEQTVDQELAKVAGSMKNIGMDPVAAESLQAEHASLGKVYRGALSNYRKGDVASVLTVDRSVRGIDRKMNEEIDALVLSIDHQGDLFLTSFSDGAKSNEEFFRALLLGLAILTSLVTFTFIFMAMRSRNSAG